MAYCTVENLVRRLGSEKELARLTNELDKNKVDEAVLDETIASADAYIDGYLRGRYTLPLTSSDSIVQDISIALVVYYLYRKTSKVPESYSKDYDSAVADLRRIQKGEIVLSTSEALAEATPRVWATHEDRAAMFDNDTLDLFRSHI